MFGVNRKPKGLFAQPRVMGAGILPGDRPDYGMGDFPAVPQGVPHNYAQNGNAGKKRGGLFGTGIQLRDVVGIAGDAVAINRGMTPMFAQAQQEERLAKQKALLAEQENQRERAEWQWRKQWERDNPAPVNNDTVADYEFIKQRLGDEAAAEFLKNKADPPQYRVGPDGRFYRVDTGGAPPPTKPVGKLTPITGGAATPAQPPFAGSGFVPPQRLQSGAMTSGRRTPEGNIAVGGVRNSKHLTGEAVDYDGPDLNALLAEARQLPGVRKAFIHNGHVHTEGDGWAAPYYGKNGTRGLKR